MTEATTGSSTRPYLIRALHEWCCDNGFTPFVTVAVDDSVQVPREFVKDGEIVLNIGVDATSGLRIGNDYLAFKARFGGVARDILVPIGQVVAIFARENGQGMAFPNIERASTEPPELPELPEPPSAPPAAPASGHRPALTRIK